MENASKALIMAAEILIGVIIITIIVLSYGNMREVSKEEISAEQVQQLAAFNREYESYMKKLLRGVDIISLMNKALDNNAQYEESYNKITIEFILLDRIEANGIIINAGTGYNQDFYNEKIKVYANSSTVNSNVFIQLKSKYFDYKEGSIEYHNETGKVKKMVFKERRIQ